MTTNAVKKLSLAPCPCPSHGLEPPYIEGVYQPDHPSVEAWGQRCNDCQKASVWSARACQCGGSGALVPGLRQKCLVDDAGIGMVWWFNSNMPEKVKHGDCQGRGWVLIPAAEQDRVLGSILLERWPEGFVLSKLMDGTFSVFILTVGVKGIVGSTATEAKAEAIWQALGVE